MYSSISFLGYNRFMDQKKKMLIVSDYFYPHWTGISKSLYYMLEAISDLYTITVLTVRYDANLRKEESLFNSKIIREPVLFSLSRAKYSLLLVFKAIPLIYTSDVVFINSPCTNILPIAILSKLFHKKLLIFHQGDLLLPKGIFNRILEKIFDIFSHYSAKMADKLATYTQDYAENSRILKKYLKKTSAIVMPVVLAQPDISCEKLHFLNQMKKEKKIIFGFAGRFVEEKGFDVLFDAIPLIIREIPDAHFVFAGETNMKYEDFFEENREKFEKVKSYLSIVGLLDSACLSAFYQKLDFLIVPSRSDCFNLVQAEAMLMKVPVIVSNIPGARDLVKTTHFGEIFISENSLDLANVVSRAYKERKKLGEYYPSVIEYLNNQKNVKKIREFIEQ